MAVRGRSHVGLWLVIIASVSVVALTLSAPTSSAQATLRWRDIRGTNYIPATSTSDNNIEMWLPRTTAAGTFDALLVDEELRELAGHGLNSIRVFGSFYAFTANPVDYERDLRALLDACRRHGLRVTFVVWDTFGRDGPVAAFDQAPGSPGPAIMACVARERQALRQRYATLPTGMGGFWFASPGRAYHAAHPSPASWDPVLAASADRYLDLLAVVFGGPYADVFHAYDLYNEPENLLLVPGMSHPTLVQISADLCQYTLARLGRRQAALAYTVGCAFISTCFDIDFELQRRSLPPLNYLSYHNYAEPALAMHNAALARYYGIVSGRDVVCSEFHQAARQGGIWALLHALQRLKIGGQIWSFIQDRVFVVEFPELAPLLGGRNHCWFHESGLIRPLADARRPCCYRFVPVDAVKCAAFTTWAADIPLPTYVAPSVQVSRVAGTLPTRYRLTVTGLAGQPAWLFVSPPGGKRMRFPGLGATILNANTRILPLGSLPATGPAGAGCLHHEMLPIVHPVVDVELQVLVGSDYTPQRWQHSRLTALSPVMRVRL